MSQEIIECLQMGLDTIEDSGSGLQPRTRELDASKPRHLHKAFRASWRVHLPNHG